MLDILFSIFLWVYIVGVMAVALILFTLMYYIVFHEDITSDFQC
jgi:hypothetical protein